MTNRYSLVNLSLVFVIWFAIQGECKSNRSVGSPDQTVEIVGEINEAEFRYKDDPNSELTVSYQFSVNGRTYSGKQEMGEKADTTQWAVGKKVKICYAPKDPANSSIRASAEVPPGKGSEFSNECPPAR